MKTARNRRFHHRFRAVRPDCRRTCPPHRLGVANARCGVDRPGRLGAQADGRRPLSGGRGRLRRPLPVVAERRSGGTGDVRYRSCGAVAGDRRGKPDAVEAADGQAGSGARARAGRRIAGVSGAAYSAASLPTRVAHHYRPPSALHAGSYVEAWCCATTASTMSVMRLVLQRSARCSRQL